MGFLLSQKNNLMNMLLVKIVIKLHQNNLLNLRMFVNFKQGTCVESNIVIILTIIFAITIKLLEFLFRREFASFFGFLCWKGMSRIFLWGIETRKAPKF